MDGPIDLHSHSRVSDGTDSPAELVRRAARLGLSVVALTDHDTFDGLDEASGEAARLSADRSQGDGIRLVRGVEMSTSLHGVSVHLLGYGCDEADPALAAELVRLRSGRGGRLQPMLDRLAELGYPLRRADVLAQVGDSPSVGRPHVADALVRAGYVADRTEAFDRLLADGGPAYIPRYATDLVTAIGLVLGAGGVPIIAHPWGRSVRRPEVVRRLPELVADAGLAGWEVDHHDHGPQVRAELGALGRRLGVITTGSSDYHGTGKVGHELGSERTDPAMWARLAERLDG